MSEKGTRCARHAAHSGGRNACAADGSVSLGEDYTGTIVNSSRDMGPGLRFIGEYTGP